MKPRYPLLPAVLAGLLCAAPLWAQTAPAAPVEAVTVTVKSDQDRREFEAPEGLPFDIVLANEGPDAWDNGSVTVTLRDSAGEPVVSKTLPMSVGAGRQNTTSMRLGPEDLKPGVYTVAAVAQKDSEPVSLASRTLVFNPGGIRHGIFPDEDAARAFAGRADAYWKATLAALQATPIGGASTLDTDRSSEKVRVYKVSFKALHGQTIHGWLTVPAEAGAEARAPGVVVLPGYGNSAIDPPIGLAENGVAALAINVHGDEVDAKFYLPEIVAYSRGGVNNPDTIALRGIVAACLRAVDYLAQRPEVDPNRLGSMGLSQGGALAVDVAALDPRVKAVVANSPGADFRRVFTANLDNPMSRLVGALSDDVKAELLNVMHLFDPVLLAERVRVPVLITIGMRDNVTPPETAYSLKNAFRNGTTVSLFVDETAGHQVTPDQFAASVAWLKKHLPSTEG